MFGAVKREARGRVPSDELMDEVIRTAVVEVREERREHTRLAAELDTRSSVELYEEARKSFVSAETGHLMITYSTEAEYARAGALASLALFARQREALGEQPPQQ